MNGNTRKVAAKTGIITTLAGEGTNALTRQGSNGNTSQPVGVAVGGHGQIFIADESNETVTLVNDSGAPASESTPGNATSSDHLTFNLLIDSSSANTANGAVRETKASASTIQERPRNLTRPRANLSSGNLTVGGTVAVTETLARDSSSSNANNVVVSGTVPNTWTITGCLLANGGLCSGTGGSTITVTYPVLASGASPVITLIADTSASTDSVPIDLSSISGSANLAAASISQTVQVSPGADITPTFQGPSSGTVAAGQVIQYTVTVANLGGATLAGDPLTVTVTLDPSLIQTSVPSAPPWICTQTNPITCTDSSGLAGGGAEARFVVYGTVPPNATKKEIISAQASFTFGVNCGCPNGLPAVNQNISTTVTSGGQTVPAFFSGEASLGSGVYYLQFPNSTPFGYYNFTTSSILYHYDMGFEAFIPGSGADT